MTKSKFFQKIAKICDIKKLKNYSMANKFCQQLIIKSLRPEKEKKMSKILKKNALFVKKNAKIRDVKMLKPFHYH